MHHSIRTRSIGGLALSLVLPIARAFSTTASAEDVTRLHLQQHNGYFAAKETLADLKPGEYEFVVTTRPARSRASRCWSSHRGDSGHVPAATG
ncbi:hypothetical protein [Thioalkalivibrio sp.]|uniref:hypothetical protein n=1 Tax=Thioalkalivibrio sp. TaxID=2093813 RepID=UPI003564B761